MNEMKKYTVREWTLAEFKANRKAWTELLHSSNADPLFSSWEWQYSWWTEGSISNKKLQIIAIYHLDELVALAPLFTYKIRLKQLLPITICQFIGCNYNLDNLCRSDNLDIIIKNNTHITKIYQQLLITINKLTWYEFRVDGASRHSHIWKLSKFNKANTVIHIERKIYNYIVKINDDFHQYTSNFKKKIRQKTILHRRFIENNQPAEQLITSKNSAHDMITSISNDDYGNFFSELNRLKEIRWGSPVYEDERLNFQNTFIIYCQNSKYLKTTSTMIKIDGKNQSAFYSIQALEQNYFLQFAFNPDFNTKISLGYIHLGLVIEQCYQNQVTQLQLLPGGGQREGYKHHFANQIQPQLTYRLKRGTWLSFFELLLTKIILLRNNYRK
ncbi:MAG: hypothetical protein ACJAS9_002808 [Polaribacter sp.]|jgi:hypothetical protein